MTRADRSGPDGEEGIIQGYLAQLANDMPGAFGLRDDAAMLSPPPGFDIVATMDAIAEGVHFLRDDDAADVGWKALAVNVSDLAGKAAAPYAYLMALSFPNLPSHQWLHGFTRGLGEGQRAFGISLAGGDTDRRPGPLTVTITALGLVPEGGMVKRGNAAAGDLIYVTGTLGGGALGLMVRRGDSDVAGWGLTETQLDHLAGRYLRPQPRTAMREALRAHASAAMDLSDGLFKDLGRMMRASGTAATVDLGKLPMCGATSTALASAPDLIRAVVAGGDDYEILATVPLDRARLFEADAARAGIAATCIGNVTAAGGDVVDFVPPGLATRLQASGAKPGYDHFE